MKIFFDFEFTGLHQATTPISLGMVSESGREFYAEFTDYDHTQVDAWVMENVIVPLVYASIENRYFTEGAHTGLAGDKRFVADSVREWIWSFDKDIQMWGDCLAYDWVLFCQMFGGASTMIDRVHYIPMDLSTLLWSRGVDPDVGREEFSQIGEPEHAQKHNALWDAKVIKACHDRLIRGYK